MVDVQLAAMEAVKVVAKVVVRVDANLAVMEDARVGHIVLLISVIQLQVVMEIQVLTQRKKYGKVIA